MKGYKKRSILILSSVAVLLVLSTVFMFSLLNRITEKMDQGSNERMISSTRMIQSSVRRQFRNDEERLKSFAGLYALRGGSVESTGILENYADATDFYRFFYMDSSGSGVDSLGEPVDISSLPFEETALTAGQSGYSDAYIGSSGRLQITFQTPVSVSYTHLDVYKRQVMQTGEIILSDSCANLLQNEEVRKAYMGAE